MSISCRQIDDVHTDRVDSVLIAPQLHLADGCALTHARDTPFLLDHLRRDAEILMRPLWTGALSFGLVNIPVRLHSAVQAKERVSFRLLHKADLSPIRYERVCEKEGDPVDWDDIVKGYEYTKGKFIALSDNDFKSAAIESSKTIEILDFVKADEIDPRYFETPYYLVPAKGGEKAYALLREAINRAGVVGIGKITMRTNTLHLAGIKTVGDAIVLEVMRFANELVDVADVEFPSSAGLRPQELADGRPADREPVGGVRPVQVRRRLPREPDEDHPRKDEGKEDREGEARRAGEHGSHRPHGAAAGESRRRPRHPWDRAPPLTRREENAESDHAPGETRDPPERMKTFSPMLATIGSELPSGDGWVFEPKYDGIRILASTDGRRVALISRNGIDKSRQFPEVADALRSLYARVKRPFVVDGEIVATRRDAPARFQALQGRMHVTNAAAIEGHRADNPAALMVFDLLLDGRKTLIAEPWRVRRRHLAALFRGAGRIRALRLGDVEENGAAMLRKARRHGWEGVIAKRSDGHYDAGRRSRSWLKLKIERRQEFVVVGWTEPRKSREHIGAILLGYYDEHGTLIYAGHTGTGFSRAIAARHVPAAQASRAKERRHSPRRRARTRRPIGRGRAWWSRSSSMSGRRMGDSVSRSSSAFVPTNRRKR